MGRGPQGKSAHADRDQHWGMLPRDVGVAYAVN